MEAIPSDPGPGGGNVLTFPIRTIVVLALCAVVHSYTSISLFPYVGTMAKELLDLDSTNTSGFYAGYVASAYMLGHFLSGYLWGYASDSVGRKPVILVGLLAVAVLSLTFGLSTTYELAISSRFVLGIMNGIMPAIRTTVYEVCATNSHVVQAMAYIDGAKAVTIVFGSAMGGLLVQPADHYPNVFSGTGLFGRFPFLLPNLVGMGLALLILPIVIVYVPETKHFEDARSRSRFSSVSSGQATPGLSTESSPARDRAVVRRPPKGGTLAYSSLEDEDVSAQQAAQEPRGVNDSGSRAVHKEGGLDTREPPVIRNREEQRLCGPGGLLSVPRVKPLLFLVCVVQSLQSGFEEVFPLWALSTVSVGGLGWGTMEIGKVLFMTGCIMVVAQLLIFPSAINILGAVTWMRTGCLLGISTLIATPNAKLFSWNYTTLFAASVASVTVVNCCLAAVSITLTVASTSIVPSRLRGKLSGLYSSAGSLGRFTSAVGFAVLFAWSISSDNLGLIDHRFVFYSCALALGVATIVAWRTLPAEVFGDKSAAENVEDEIHDAGLTP
ncbi:unnamed protein product [Ectocarpus sp. 8 AP-2014]